MRYTLFLVLYASYPPHPHIPFLSMAVPALSPSTQSPLYLSLPPLMSSMTQRQIWTWRGKAEPAGVRTSDFVAFGVAAG